MTDHMDTLADVSLDTTQIPYLDDGTINVLELIRSVAEAAINEVMDQEAQEACAEGNSRNGYRQRDLKTTVGTIHLRIPKLRLGTYFPDSLLKRYSRSDKALVAAVAEMITEGVSTRKVAKVAEKLGVERMSASQVSRIASSLDGLTEELRKREFKDISFPYLWLDATYIKCRDEGHVCSEALVTAIATNNQGYKQLVGFDLIDTETYMGWKNFLASLKTRGVGGVYCVVSDAHEGLRRAIEEVFSGASWQRCIVHLERDVCAKAKNKRERQAIGALLKSVFKEKDPKLVRAMYEKAQEKIEGFSKPAAKLLEEAEADALVYLDFPYKHHIRLRTNNIQERCNREIKRRSRVVQVFPSRKSLLRLVGAVLSEMDEDWGQRRWFSSIDEVKDMGSQRVQAPKPTYLGTAEEQAQKVLAPVIAEYIDPLGKAA